jgi:hypothetical protein
MTGHVGQVYFPNADAPRRMGSLKDNLSRQLHADGNPWDDGPLPDLT